MTKKEQKEMILRKLYWMKKNQEENLRIAKAHGSRPGSVTFDCPYRGIDVLETTIREALGINPVSFEKRLSTVPGTKRSCFVTKCTFSDEDNKKVAEVIRRMVEQGFIRIREAHGFTMVEVLKTR